jgi:hypothetical protein
MHRQQIELDETKGKIRGNTELGTTTIIRDQALKNEALDEIRQNARMKIQINFNVSTP